MIENFIEYMWYLLTTPLKKLKKNLNKWYILCKVFGRRFDEAKEDILRAREEGMVATCCHEMLSQHAADRGLTRYNGEELENFRARIAMYEEVCRLGGLNEGVLMAVRSLGYNNPRIERAAAFRNAPDRWAEFYLVICMSVDEEHPISFGILKKTVRQWKEAGAKDNYYMAYRARFSAPKIYNLSLKYRHFIYFFGKRKNLYCARQTYHILLHHATKIGVIWHEEHNLYYLDGTWQLNGSRLLDAYQNTEELL